MSGKDTKIVHWDTCIFYALLKGETKHGQGVLQGIRNEFSAFRSGNLSLITSMIAVAEVAQGNFDNPKTLEEFKELRYAPGFQFCDAIFPIMELTSDLKDYYYNNPLGDKGEYNLLDLGDALHLATAITWEATDFVTLDKNHKKSGEIGLLQLGNVVAGEYELNIRKPIPPAQGDMLDEQD